MNKEKIYIIYEIKENGDLLNIYDSINRDIISKIIEVDKTHLNEYTTTSIDNLNDIKIKHINNKHYFILKDILDLNDNYEDLKD